MAIDCQEEHFDPDTPPAPAEKPTKPVEYAPRVSLHALLRYLERGKGVDVEGARREILTPAVAQAIRRGATGFILNGLRFIVRKGVVMTCHDRSQQVNGQRMKSGPPRRERDALREEV
jgi:hypothetical protein